MNFHGVITRILKAATGVTRLPSAFTSGASSLVRDIFPGAWQMGATPVQPASLGEMSAFGAVYACVSRIAMDVSKLRPQLLQRADGIPTLAPANSPYWRVLRQPNRYQNWTQFIVSWITSKLIFGNTYVLIRREEFRGVPTEILVLDPRTVTPMVTPDGDVYYALGSDAFARGEAGATLPASEVLHDRHVTLWHPLVGVAPITACGASVTQGMRIQSNSAKFFENMSRPSGMLTAPGAISQTTADRLRKDWEENYAGVNIGRLAVLGDGLKYEAMTIPAHDAQLMEQLKWTGEDVGRCFSVPLYKIGVGPVPTSGNVEALETQYYSGCLQWYIECVEALLTTGLGVPPSYDVELDLEGLLRMDSAARVDVLSKAVTGAIMKPDEARARMRLPPVPGGDTVYLQQQNYSLAALAKRDAREDPFGSAAPPPPTGGPAEGDLANPEDDGTDAELETLSAAIQNAELPNSLKKLTGVQHA